MLNNYVGCWLLNDFMTQIHRNTTPHSDSVSHVTKHDAKRPFPFGLGLKRSLQPTQHVKWYDSCDDKMHHRVVRMCHRTSRTKIADQSVLASILGWQIWGCSQAQKVLELAKLYNDVMS